MDPTVSPPRRRWSVWIVVGLILLFGVITPLLLIVAVAAAGPRVKPGTVVVVRFEGEIPEAAPDTPFAGLTSGGHGLSLHELRLLVDTVSTDRKVAGVLCEIGNVATGFATVSEIQETLGKLRDAKKPLQAILAGDFVEEKEYGIALSADRIAVVPEAAVLLNGLVAEVAFYRGTLDKIHIQPQIFQFKEYKSAAEPLMNHEMSPAMRESYTSLLGDIYANYMADASKRRGIPEATLRALFDRGGLTSKEALDAKLVDAVGHSEDVEAELRGRGNVAVKGSPRMSAGKYLAAAHEKTEGEEIAIVYGVGAISASGRSSLFGGEGIQGPRLAAAIREAAEDDDVKAIILRVNSPGGSAVGSDFIWREVKAAKQKKPVVVSMGDVAGSGGYWISMAADAIVAHPSTLTGSIGVVGGKIDVRGLYEWAGANIDTVKVGANADLMSAYRLFDTAQADRFKAWMGAVYDDFVHRVAEGRGLKYEEVEPNAHGRVWTGSQAKERKLVDELGGLDRAIAIAREKAKIPDSVKVHLKRFPHRKSLLDLLADGDLPVVRTLVGLSDLDGAIDAELAEWETLQPWVLAPKIRIH
jgi:protease IV